MLAEKRVNTPNDHTKTKALLYALVVYTVLFLICYFGFVELDSKTTLELGGVEVNFGNSNDGMGTDFSAVNAPSPKKQVSIQPAATHAEKAAPSEAAKPQNPVETQNTEEAATVAQKNSSKPGEVIDAETVSRKKPQVNQNALYKGPVTRGGGAGDGITGKPGNEGKPNGSVLSNQYAGLGGGGVALSLEGRSFLIKPNLQDDGQSVGTIAVDITADRDGNIIEAVAGARGTTLENDALWKKCETAARSCRLNRIKDGPETQSGKLMFTFKLK